MAERRMFAKCIVTSDAFLDMPASARLLYFDLGMRADDDGFVNSPKKVMRETGASQDDLLVLLAKRFVLNFDSGVVVLKHWRMNNYIQSDRYKPTVYQEELAALNVKDNKAYTLKSAGQSGHVYSLDTGCIQDVSKMDTQVRLGKDSLGKDRKEEGQRADARMPRPTVDEVTAFMAEAGLTHFTAEQFVSYYESNGWKVGKNPMKDWKAACRSWEQRRKSEISDMRRNKEEEVANGGVYSELW